MLRSRKGEKIVEDTYGCYMRARARSRKNRHNTLAGFIVWRDQDSFGLETKVHGESVVVTCYYDEWEITYYD